MDFHTVLDISAIIWDREDYNSANRHEYYGLVNSVLKLLDKLKKEQPKILLRKELLSELINNFPSDELPHNFYEFSIGIYDFLGMIGSNVITYPDNIVPDLISIPDLVKPHYNETTKNEVYYLISTIHADDETENVYFTFQYLWDDDADKLKTQLGEDSKEYETIICDKIIKSDDDLTELDIFFAKFKPVFEHNPKHDKTPYNDKEGWESSDNKRDFISRLSCYNGTDNNRPQELLDSAVKYENIYINYDGEHWVIFRCHLDNKYHGYDEYDSNQIPEEVKKQFNK